MPTSNAPTKIPAEKTPLSPLKKWSPLIVALIVLGFFAPWLVGPGCPKKITIATGSPDGAYFAFANEYRKVLAQQGITLEVQCTAGSIENAEILASDLKSASPTSLAMIQGGTASAATRGKLESLASLYLEPVWVFCRSDEPIDRFHQLKGRRIAIGPEGSGTRSVALLLLEENAASNQSGTNTQYETVDFGGADAASRLKSGQIDAAFFVISPSSPIISDLMTTEGLELMNCSRAGAYLRKHPFLSSVTVPEGLFDLERNLPSRDIVLLAPAANLVARSDLHPALVALMLQAAQQVHAEQGLLSQPVSFPSPSFVDFTLSDEARHFFKTGPSFLFRYFPFQTAAWLDRMKLLLLPLCTLLIPLLKVAPPVYRWRIRSKIYKWYRDLRTIDQKLKNAEANCDLSGEIRTLEKLELELIEVSVPLSYMEEFYNLRLHVTFVMKKLHRHNRQLDTRTSRTNRNAA